ncbi:MAG: serine hydrolase [Gemmatimonadetes bacterium]|nr:serine hydrolase [Gemmatimonadota bacterium]
MSGIPNYGQRITVRQLIHHTSGLRDQWQLLGYAGWRFPRPDHRAGRPANGLSRQKGTNFAPGAEWAYSNTGYTAGRIVKRVSGSRCASLPRTHLCPAGDARHALPRRHDDRTGRTSAYEPRPWRRVEDLHPGLRHVRSDVALHDCGRHAHVDG